MKISYQIFAGLGFGGIAMSIGEIRHGELALALAIVGIACCLAALTIYAIASRPPCTFCGERSDGRDPQLTICRACRAMYDRERAPYDLDELVRRRWRS